MVKRALTGDGGSYRRLSSTAFGTSDEVGRELGALVRVPFEQVDGPAEVSGDGLGPGAEQHGDELGELGVGQAPRGAVVVDDLGVEQVGEHVVARVPLAVLELLDEVAVDLDEGLDRHVVHHPDGTLLDVEDVVDDAPQVVAVPSGTPRSIEIIVGGRTAEKSCT